MELRRFKFVRATVDTGNADQTRSLDGAQQHMIPRGRTSSKLIAATLSLVLMAAGLALTSASPAGAINVDEQGFFDATNAYRQANGLAPLQYDANASAVALGWSQSMASAGVLSHNPNLVAAINTYVTPDWTRIGENVGFGPTVSSIQNAFINSPPHRANILGDYNRVGIGVVRDASNTIWVTLDFVKGPDLPVAPPPPPPPPPIDPKKAPAESTWPSGRVDVFQRGQDGALWGRAFVNGSWTSWYTLGGSLASEPTAASWGGGRIDVFATGTDGALWHRALSGGVWQPWDVLGGSFTSGPGAVSSSKNHIDVFARGLDGALWGRSLGGSTWGPWYTLGGKLASAPDVSSWGSGRLDLFAIGLDGGVWHRAFTSGAWQAWDGLGGQVTAGLGATSWGTNRIDVMSRGGDGAMWADSWTGTKWSGWYSLGGNLTSAPDVAAPASNRLIAAARGSDGLIWLKSLTSSGWAPWVLLG
jgi:uncharacterized protein YkwD